MSAQKHAYLILAHSRSGQLCKLLALLDDPRNDIYIHIDRKARFSPKDFSDCCSASRLFFVEPRLRVHWGGVSIMRATLALLKAAVPGHYAYYHLLSGMDLPIKTQDEIHAFFDAHPDREFLQLWPYEASKAIRLRYFTLMPEQQSFFLTRTINHLVKGILIALDIQINRGIDFHYGSQWFSISDAFACYTVDQEDWLERVFRHTGVCDEEFLPTLLMNSPFRDRLFDASLHDERQQCAGSGLAGNLRLIDWTRGESVRHPWTFRSEDWEMLMHSPCLWARKFDERVDPEIIGRVCSHLRPGK